jgi:hypothetical protein
MASADTPDAGGTCAPLRGQGYADNYGRKDLIAVAGAELEAELCTMDRTRGAWLAAG